MNVMRILPWAVLVALSALPVLFSAPYAIHIVVQVLLWSFVYTSWSVMGRFGLVSLGHGGFMGVGAYGTALLWNNLGLSPWLGIPVSVVAAMALALVVAYPCFRFRITGHYFALVPKPMRKPSASRMVMMAPIVGPISTYNPPTTTANTICRDTEMPLTVSGEMNIWYWQ